MTGPDEAGRRVLAVLPRGEAIRTHVYSRALERVQDRAAVHLASVRPNDEIWKVLEAGFASVTELRERPEPRPVRLVREALEVAHGRWIGSEAALERWRRRDLEAASLAGTAKNVVKRQLTRPLANPTALDGLDAVYERARRRTASADGSVLDRVRPDLVFNASHVHSRIAEPLLIDARAAGVRTAAFLFSWDNLTSQGRIVPRYDGYLAWNAAIRDDLLRLYPRVDPASVVVTGTPQFDFHFWPELEWSRERLAGEIGIDPSRPYVLYTTGMPNHMPDEPWIVEDLADRLDPGGPQLVLRVYAKDRSGRFDDLRRRRPDITFVPSYWEPEWLTPLPEDTALLTNLLRHADVGVNVASTVSLELCMFDRAVVNVAYNPPSVPRSAIDYAGYYRFDHYAPVVASGAIDVVRSPEELGEAIRRAVADPAAGRSSRRALLASMFHDTLDGRSHERVAAAVAELAGA